MDPRADFSLVDVYMTEDKTFVRDKRHDFSSVQIIRIFAALCNIDSVSST